MLHKDGSPRWIMARGTAIRDKQGNPIRVVDPGEPAAFIGEYVAPHFRKVRITLKLTDSKTGLPAERFQPHIRYFVGGLVPSKYSTQYYNMEKTESGVDAAWA